MTYRLNLLILNAFCLFSLLFVGCKDKVIDPFIQYNLIKISNSKIHTDNDFPQSIDLDNVKDSLLRAGKYNSYSFYIEYYKLNDQKIIKAKVLKNGNWSSHKNFKTKVETIKFNNKTLKESSIYFQDKDFLMYGVFIGPKATQFENIIIGFKNKP
ncbi:MAG: hypothetical protein COB02_08910 [Candidatus Cloacimonadota bacterium]|nr:MAG: hypothetical protein COB02_08910 [Candidatus Cloacimonadota bacterium]